MVSQFVSPIEKHSDTSLSGELGKNNLECIRWAGMQDEN